MLVASTPLSIVHVGNHSPLAPHSTETHVADAFEAVGHRVRRLHEAGVDWVRPDVDGADLVVWTTTGDLFRRDRWPAARAWLSATQRPPVVSHHLDRWWGLARERDVTGRDRNPWFDTDLVVTADGGHPDQWKRHGVKHRWLPPGVARRECEPAEPHPAMRARIGFVGSWHGYGHLEWPHRQQLVDWLSDTYPRDVRFWPSRGRHAVRGEPLRRLYASIDVAVGDSCLAGGARAYISDRCPETLGRGGYLVHPAVEGITDGGMYTDGEHLDCWPVGDWNALRQVIDRALDDPERRRRIAERGRAHTLAHHTYDHRAVALIGLAREAGLL